MTIAMKIHRPGFPAALKRHGNMDLPVLVLTASVKPAGVTYEVAWWDGVTRVTQWVSEHEVVEITGERLGLGFHTIPRA